MTNTIVSSEALTVRQTGELAARAVIGDWKGSAWTDAASAALKLGHLEKLLGNRAHDLLKINFEMRKVDEARWPDVNEAYLHGRGTDLSRKEVLATYGSSPAASRDSVSFEPSPFVWREPKTIPPRDWIYGRHLLRRHVSATIASGAVGKTSLKIVQALALATGRDLLGQGVPERACVWLFNLEDDRDEIDRRIAAAMMHYGIKPEDVEGYLFVEGETQLVITMTDRSGTKVRKPVVDALTNAIRLRAVDVLIVDPFVSSHDAPESDNGAMDAIIKQGWVVIAREADCAIDICHHTTKADATSGMATAMSARGGGSFIAACRSVEVLNPMTADEASKAGLASAVGYFSAFGDKQNLTPKSSHREWFCMDSVNLENGGGTGNLNFMNSDSVGVVTRWDWPTAGSFIEDVTVDQFQAIKNHLRVGKFRKDQQAKDWAGVKVGEVLGIDTCVKAERQRITKMLDTWTQRGDLREYKAKDEYRVMKDYIGVPDMQHPAAP